MNIDSVYFKKKDIVNSREAFNELEKIRLKAKQWSLCVCLHSRWLWNFCLDKCGPLKDSDAETLDRRRAVSACPAVLPSPFTKEDASNSKSFSQRFSARKADSDPASRVTAREPPGQPCNGGRQHGLWAGLQVAQDRLPLELCSFVCVRLLPRRACSNQVSKTVAGPKDHTGSPGARQSATNGRPGVDTAVR